MKTVLTALALVAGIAACNKGGTDSARVGESADTMVTPRSTTGHHDCDQRHHRARGHHREGRGNEAQGQHQALVTSSGAMVFGQSARRRRVTGAGQVPP